MDTWIWFFSLFIVIGFYSKRFKRTSNEARPLELGKSWLPPPHPSTSDMLYWFILMGVTKGIMANYSKLWEASWGWYLFPVRNVNKISEKAALKPGCTFLLHEEDCCCMSSETYYSMVLCMCVSVQFRFIFPRLWTWLCGGGRRQRGTSHSIW